MLLYNYTDPIDKLEWVKGDVSLIINKSISCELNYDDNLALRMQTTGS